MGRTIDYSALPALAEIYGINDVETLLIQLVAIRDHKWPNQ